MAVSARALSPTLTASSSSRCSRTASSSRSDTTEREEPDSKGEDVVRRQRLLEKRVVRAAVERAMDPLVELDQRPLVAGVGDVVERVEQRAQHGAVVVGDALGREARTHRLERRSHLREARGGRRR